MQEEHSRQIREVLKNSNRVELLEVNYRDLVADPDAAIAKVAKFLGVRFENTPKSSCRCETGTPSAKGAGPKFGGLTGGRVKQLLIAGRH